MIEEVGATEPNIGFHSGLVVRVNQNEHPFRMLKPQSISRKVSSLSLERLRFTTGDDYLVRLQPSRRHT